MQGFGSMVSLNLWWQGFLTAIGLYFVFLLGQVIGYYKSYSNNYECYNGDDDGFE
jgi:hypothetical protein